MTEWTVSKIAGLIIAVIVLMIIIYFLYTYLNAESGSVGAIENIWAKHAPATE